VHHEKYEVIVITVSAASAVPGLFVVTVAVAVIGVANALVRLSLCALAVYAARQALREPDADKLSESACTHQLAVLCIIMATLSQCGHSRWRHTAAASGPLATPAAAMHEHHAADMPPAIRHKGQVRDRLDQLGLGPRALVILGC
jgi:hypothetical protein